MKNPLVEDPHYNLWVLLNQARQAVRKVRNQELNQYGLSASQAAILFAIKAIGRGAAQKTISKWVFREPHTVSGILSRMEKQGLVTKTRNPQRKSEIFITLTKKGQQAYKNQLNIESIRGAMSCLSGKERQQLKAGLEKVRDQALKNAGEAKIPPFPRPYDAE